LVEGTGVEPVWPR